MNWTSPRQIFAIDLRTLAFFRICLACVLLGDLADRAIDLSAHYSDGGILPRYLLLLHGSWRPSFHLISGSALFQGALFLIAAISASALLFGYRTRAATITCWLLTMSLQVRKPLLAQGGDVLILSLLFWSIFLPLGARYSIDAALTPGSRANTYFSIATLALLFQVMYVYFFGALLKTGDTWLVDGTAVALAMQSEENTTPFGQWLRTLPALTRPLTYSVFYLELLAPLLMFAPLFHVRLRLITLALLFGMHLGFFVFLKVGIFPFASLTSLLVFIPGAVWDWLERRFRADSPVRIYYDEPCGFCLKMCLLLRTFLLLPKASIEPAQPDAAIGPILERENSWVVVDADGTQYLRWDAMILLVRRSPLFAPLARVMQWRPLHRLGTYSYYWVARNRAALGVFSQRFLSYAPSATKLPTAVSVLVGALFIAILYANVVRSPLFPFQWPNGASPITTVLGMRQYWGMFAPDPPTEYLWYVAVGELVNGEKVNVLYPGQPPTYEPPDNFAGFVSRHRWRWYYRRMLRAYPEIGPRLLAHYLCERWDAQHHTQHHDSRLLAIRLGYLSQSITPEGPVGPLRHVELVEGACSELSARPRLVPASGQ